MFIRWTPCFLVLIGLFSLSTPAHAQPGPDEEAIEKVLTDYIEGWREADTARLGQIMDQTEGRVMWITEKDGTQALSSMTFGEVLKRRKPQSEYGLNWKVLELDVIEGQLAVARVFISRRGGSYIDVLVLQKLNQQWFIVNKTFVSRTDPSPPEES